MSHRKRRRNVQLPYRPGTIEIPILADTFSDCASIGNALSHGHTHCHAQFDAWICISMAPELYGPLPPSVAHMLLIMIM